VGDIEYLATQEFNGNVIRLQGDISILTNTLTHTVTVGKDAYILVAKIVPSGFVQAATSASGNVLVTGNNQTEAKISSDGTELDRITVGTNTATRSVLNLVNNAGSGTGGSGAGSLTDGLFHAAIGSKTLPTLDIEIENTLDNGNCIAQMVILEVDTGTTPAL